MSRKLLTLGYIYEIMGKNTKALMCFEQILQKDSKKLDADIIKEARLGVKANKMALRYRKNKSLVTKNMDMKVVEEKLEKFRENPKKLIGWFSKWS